VKLTVEGDVRAPRTFHFADLAALPDQVGDIARIVPGRQGGAVTLAAVLESVGASSRATSVTLESTDGEFVQTAPLEGVRSALLLYRVGEAPLPPEQGGPIRFLVPNAEDCDVPGVDRCTNVKSLGVIRVG
jgi:DMSO/TMAO reductase YedYZ molybdopterin-dependent catalytic subunit